MLLFDCGEGTQISMRRLGWGFKALDTICLSHLHADHAAGLPGLLLTVGNAGRSEPLTIFGPTGTEAAVRGLRAVAPVLPYEVVIQELNGGETMSWAGAQLGCLAVDHALPCLAYRVDLSRARRFDPARARALGLPVPLWKGLQHGDAVEWQGRSVAADEVLGPDRRGLRLAYVTDTRPTSELPSFLAEADLLVSEGTYGDPADAERAVENKHMLFGEAAMLARAAGAKRLWLTHFSAKLTQPADYLPHATAVFPPTVIGHDHLTGTLSFADEDPNG